MKISKVNGVVWFTNLKKNKHKPLNLTKSYNPSEYPMYDNYNAIECGRVCDIPNDYLGYMGVPITYLGQHCPDQFEIIGMESSAGYDPDIVGIPRLKEGDARPAINGKTTYARIIIKRK